MTRKPWTAGKGKIKVRWNKQDNVTRYEVRYSKNKSFKKGTYKTKKVNAAVNAYTTQRTEQRLHLLCKGACRQGSL